MYLKEESVNRAQRRALRQAMGTSIVIPGPLAIWLLYALCVAALVKYVIS